MVVNLGSENMEKLKEIWNMEVFSSSRNEVFSGFWLIWSLVLQLKENVKWLIEACWCLPSSHQDFFLSYILAWNLSCCHKGCAFLAAAWLAQTENINNFTMCKHLLLATNARRWVSNAGHHFCFVWFGMAMLAQPFCRLHCRSHTRSFYRPAYSSCD